MKRINTNALSHLSSHTEHWKARTLSGLIPKRLRADIIEDEINIYENLFFKMAIDDISDYVTAEILSLQKSMEKNSIAIDWERYGNVINDYRRGELIDRYVITDFEIEPDEGSGNVKIYPICPICGGRRKR